LEDPKTGEFNLLFIRRQFPDEDFAVVTFALGKAGQP
jgi:putative molybdopterin biosynthesis protein